MCALSAWSARAALSAGLSRPSGSTSRSNLARKALRAAWVRADRSDVLAHEVCAPRRPRSAAELLTKARRQGQRYRPAPAQHPVNAAARISGDQPMVGKRRAGQLAREAYLA